MNAYKDLCKCGHERQSHIYAEGACRPGFVCEWRCEKFELSAAQAWLNLKNVVLEILGIEKMVKWIGRKLK